MTWKIGERRTRRLLIKRSSRYGRFHHPVHTSWGPASPGIQVMTVWGARQTLCVKARSTEHRAGGAGLLAAEASQGGGPDCNFDAPV